MTPAQAIIRIRKELCLSQRQLGEAVKCTQTAISAYERGERHPQYSILKRLDEFAKSKNIKVDFL